MAQQYYCMKYHFVFSTCYVQLYLKWLCSYSEACIMQNVLIVIDSNRIYFKSLKSQWFSGPYMSNTHTNTNIQAYTIWENEENFSKNT